MGSNRAQSVRDRLLNRTRQTGEDHQIILTRFALERLLYRLTQLPIADEFVLKGAFAFLVWEGEQHRMTRDLDLLGRGAPDPEQIRSVFERACTAKGFDDGVTYDPDSLEANSIRADALYDGLRVHLLAYIGSARLPLQIDVGFGDAVTPSPVRDVFPSLLDFPEPTISTYPPETTVSEKLHGMVHFGRANSRMKDFYDVWRISRIFSLNGESVREAIRATFARRKTSVPEDTPVGLTTEFAGTSSRKQQWQAFANRLRLEISLGDVLSDLRSFLLPILQAVRNEEPTPDCWHPEEGWTST